MYRNWSRNGYFGDSTFDISYACSIVPWAVRQLSQGQLDVLVWFPTGLSVSWVEQTRRVSNRVLYWSRHSWTLSWLNRWRVVPSGMILCWKNWGCGFLCKLPVYLIIDGFYITSKFGVKRLTWNKVMNFSLKNLNTILRPALTTLEGIFMYTSQWNSSVPFSITLGSIAFWVLFDFIFNREVFGTILGHFFGHN